MQFAYDNETCRKIATKLQTTSQIKFLANLDRSSTMPFYKYRPNKQWGKMNGRIFRQVYARRVKQFMPTFDVPKVLVDKDVQIYDPNDVDFPNSVFPPPPPPSNEHHPALFVPTDVHRKHYQSTPAQIFDGSEPMAAGLDQALQLSRCVLRRGLPSSVYKPSAASLGDTDMGRRLVKNAIMHAHSHDGTTETLPQRLHRDIWWHTPYEPMEGLTRERSNTTVMRNLVRTCITLGTSSSIPIRETLPSRDNIVDQLRDLRIVEDATVSACFDVGDEKGHPLALSYATPLMLVCPTFVPSVVGDVEVRETAAESVVDVRPIHPYIDAKQTNVYRTEGYYPGVNLESSPYNDRRLYIHTVFSHYTPPHLYEWSDQEIKAKCFMHALAAAGALRDKRNTHPVTVQSIQLCEGVLNMCVLQLNTSAFTNDFKKKDLYSDDGGVKNICWFDQEVLYEPCPMWDPFTDVRAYNPKAFDKFFALISNCHYVKEHSSIMPGEGEGRRRWLK